MADGKSGLQIIDVTRPYYPTLVGSIDTDGSAIGVNLMLIEEKIFALVADRKKGLKIIEVSDP